MDEPHSASKFGVRLAIAMAGAALSAQYLHPGAINTHMTDAMTHLSGAEGALLQQFRSSNCSSATRVEGFDGGCCLAAFDESRFVTVRNLSSMAGKKGRGRQSPSDDASTAPWTGRRCSRRKRPTASGLSVPQQCATERRRPARPRRPRRGQFHDSGQWAGSKYHRCVGRPHQIRGQPRPRHCPSARCH